jgi:hypothetical protein
MPSVHVDQGLLHDVPKPHEKGHLGLLDEVRDPLCCVQVRLLKDIVSVDPTSQARMETEVHHTPEPLAVLREERSKGGLVPLAQAVDEGFGSLHGFDDLQVRTKGNANGAESSTGDTSSCILGLAAGESNR